MDPVLVPAGSGSGFIWDKEGHVVTNYHVVRGAAAAKVVVEGSDGKMKEYEAKLVGSNPDKDIAVLQLQGGLGNLVPVTPAVSETGRVTPVRVGQTVLAIGNPFGLDHTLTLGIVSGLGREITSVTGRPITNLLQTDAAINPGNSGGALLDSKGRLIGMNTAILSPSGSNAGIGFAIPVETLKFQVDTLIRDGAVRKPVIGISLASRGQARTLGVQRGVLVMEVPADTAASKAGIRATERVQYGVRLGDVITGFGEDTVDNETDLFRAIDKYSPGDKVVLTVERLVDKGDGELEQQSATIPLVLSAAESVDPNPRIMKPGER